MMEVDFTEGKKNIGITRNDFADTIVYRGVYRYGWICPKCGKVYSPEYFECMNCNNDWSITSVWVDNNDWKKSSGVTLSHNPEDTEIKFN